MKTLCPKPGKGGKIHPSPAAEDPIAAAFRLLPAAILVLVAGLCPEDQRVLAHLVTRSFLVGWDAATAPPPEQQARGGGGGGAPRRRRAHPPTVGCLCFECYGSFWSRWDCSPQHDRIHDALEAFEEHLRAAESAAAATPPSSKRRDKGKRGRAPAPATTPPPPPPARSSLESSEPASEVAKEPISSPLFPSCPPTPPAPAAACLSENKENVPEETAAPEAKAEECGGGGGEVAAEAEEERKRGWADVMGGVLNLRRWGIWSPAVESGATAT